MEDAHIASINLGNAPDAAIFGVFDGHGGRSAPIDWMSMNRKKPVRDLHHYP